MVALGTAVMKPSLRVFAQREITLLLRSTFLDGCFSILPRPTGAVPPGHCFGTLVVASARDVLVFVLEFTSINLIGYNSVRQDQGILRQRMLVLDLGVILASSYRDHPLQAGGHR
ncbi:unnamed protein product [Ectocarpus sp. 4 AP-2014]